MDFERIRTMARKSMEEGNIRGWPKIEIIGKNNISDIISLRVELSYDFTSGENSTKCDINKNIEIVEDVYLLTNSETQETSFIGKIEKVPSIFRNVKFNSEILVLKNNDSLIFVMYGTSDNIDSLKDYIDYKLNKFIKMQIHAKSNSSTVDAKTIQDMLKFLEPTAIISPDKVPSDPLS